MSHLQVTDVGNLAELVRWRGQHEPERRAFTFLGDGVIETERHTYESLDRASTRAATLLQQLTTPGNRVVLLYPAGLEFITAFFGCIYAGVIPVPAPPPELGRLNRTLPRLRAIVQDATPSLVLTTSKILAILLENESYNDDFNRTRFVSIGEEEIAPCGTTAPFFTIPHSVAFLQYSSGSTSSPKGIVVSNANLMCYLGHLGEAMGYEEDSIYCSWMPNYHDYGLIEGILHPVYRGIPCYLMPPFAFVQRPLRWLQAISRYHVTHSSGPNFAYELCVRKTRPEERALLDLSRWRVVGNAAEPVRHETLLRFLSAFGLCGIQSESLRPCYGLAEATLLVTAGRNEGPKFTTVVREEFEKGRVKEASQVHDDVRMTVGCGRSLGDTRVIIVNPETHRCSSSDELGEIWVAGRGVASGYWNNAEATTDTFCAFLSDTGEGPFLRTGDIGFFRGEELFIAGRLKDLIIVDGVNHYPQDIEWTVERCHPAIRAGCTAAFSVERGDGEELVIVAEVDRQYWPEGSLALDQQAVIGGVHRAIGEQHCLPIADVLLLSPGNIPKTSSGKIQRRACRTRYLEGLLPALPANGVLNNNSGDGTATYSRSIRTKLV